MKHHQLWTDGSGDGLLRVGSYAALVVGEQTTLVYGNAQDTTSNRMELYAVLAGLQTLPAGITVRVYTDSSNVIQWLRKEKPISHPAIQHLVDQVCNEAEVKSLTLVLKKVPAHKRIANNVRCDQACRKALRDARSGNFYHRKEEL